MAAITKKLTPVLMVDAVEPCVAFWVERLGWTQAVAVPHENALGFVILTKDGVEIMYQTWASVEADLGRTLPRARAPSVGLFVEVSDIEDMVRKVKGLPLALERRRTFYGMEEIGVTEPGGHLVIFAQPAEAKS